MVTRREKIVKWAATVVMLLLSLIMIFPVFIMIGTSIKSTAEVYSSQFYLLPYRPRLENYTEVLRSGDWGRYFLNSTFIAVVNVAVSLTFNSLAGFAFARVAFRGKHALFLVSMVAMMVPAQVTMLPLFILLKNFPLVGGNNLLGVGGTGFINTLIGVCLPALAGSYGVFLCRQFYVSFPDSLDDAAEIDGCGKWQTYWRIFLPLSKPILATLGTLKLTGAWNDYIWPLVMIQSKERWTVQLALALFKGQSMVQWNLLMAATLLTTIPVVLFFLFGQRFFVGSIVISGMK